VQCDCLFVSRAKGDNSAERLPLCEVGSIGPPASPAAKDRGLRFVLTLPKVGR
jgi:hypothetical protein